MITGIGAHDPPDSMFIISWNRRSRSTGFSVHDPPEHATYQISDAEVQQANRLFDDLMQRLEATLGDRARPVVSGRLS
jgi:hypothetical protein